MNNRMVLALGGNALGHTPQEQAQAARNTAKAIAGLVETGRELLIVHGNGPQVGMIQLAMESAAKTDAKTPPVSLSACVAMSQAYIGFDLQNALSEELRRRGLHVPVVSIVTQSLVGAGDPAFQTPTKPIGSFYSEQEARRMMAGGLAMMEDAGRGWRRVVASPKPVDIVEKNSIETLLSAGQIVIAAGGGGIPVVRREDGRLEDVPAVVDKDFAAALMGEIIDAQDLMILTAVEKVAVNFGKPDETWLDSMTAAEAARHMEDGQFAPGSMLPKVKAAVQFAQSKPGRTARITLLDKAEQSFAGQTGTLITT